MLSRSEIFSRRLALISVLVAPFIIFWDDLTGDDGVKQKIIGYAIGLFVVGIGAGIISYFGAKGVFWALSRDE